MATTVQVTERWLNWDGMRYRVWERPVPGSSVPPLVLVHGYGACVEQWGRFIRDIGPEVPVYALDLIGYGEASKPRDVPYGRSFYVRQLEHMRGQYGWDRVIAVGHSMGGMIAIEWAATVPEAVASVIVVAPAGMHTQSSNAIQRRFLRALSNPVAIRTLYGVVTRLPYRSLSGGAYADYAVRDPATEAALRRSMQSPGAVWSYSAPLRSPDAFRLVAEGGDVRCPLHIIWGGADRGLPYENSALFTKRFPHATLTKLEGGGHCVHEERAREVAAEVRTLLTLDDLLAPAPAPLMVAE